MWEAPQVPNGTIPKTTPAVGHKITLHIFGFGDPSGSQQVLDGDRREGVRRKAMAHVQDLYSNETLLVIEVDSEPVVDLS